MCQHRDQAIKLLEHYLLRAHSAEFPNAFHFNDPDASAEIEGIVDSILDASARKIRDELNTTL